MKLFRMFLVSLALSLIFAGAALAKADVTELYAEALMTGDVESLDKAYNGRHALYKQLASLPHPGSEN